MGNLMKIPSGGDMNATLLWENPNPTNTFGHTGLKLNDDLANYSYILIKFKAYRNVEKPLLEVLFKLGEDQYNYGAIRQMFGVAHDEGVGYMRYVTLQMDKPREMQIGRSYSNANGSADDGRIIPTAVYGIKGKISGISGGG